MMDVEEQDRLDEALRGEAMPELLDRAIEALGRMDRLRSDLDEARAVYARIANAAADRLDTGRPTFYRDHIFERDDERQTRLVVSACDFLEG